MSNSSNHFFIKYIIIPLLFVCFTLGFCLLILFKADYKSVNLSYDGRDFAFNTFHSKSDDILGQMQFSADENDIVQRTDDGKSTSIVVYKAHNIIFDDDGEKIEVLAAGTVADALKKAEIELRKNDAINVPLQTLITNNFTATITRSFEVMIKADGKRIYSNSSGGSVLSLLNENNIKLGKDDEINHKLDETITKGMRIIIKRVKYKTISTDEAISFKKENQFTDALFSDQSEIVQNGEDGIKRTFFLQKTVDGKVESKKKLFSLTVKDPVDEITLVGTQRRITYVDPSSSVISELTPDIPIELDSNGRPLKYSKLIIGEATAYSGGTICSTGVKAMPGRVAVDPREIPYGTKMYIVSVDGKYNYGYSIAADTGGFIYTSDTVVDLRFNSESACRQFGRRDVEIYILD